MTESKGRLKLIARLFRMCWLLVGWVGHGGCLRVYEGSFVLLSLMFCVNVTLYWHWSPTNLKRLPIDRQSSYANRICSFCGHFSKAASFDPFVLFRKFVRKFDMSPVQWFKLWKFHPFAALNECLLYAKKWQIIERISAQNSVHLTTKIQKLRSKTTKNRTECDNF